MTLYLSRLRLNPRNREAATHLNRPYEMHRTILKALPAAADGGPGRVLFRTEPYTPARAQEITVLVQSDTEPVWERAIQGYPREMLLEPPEWRRLSAQFESGTLLRFRLRANPTRRSSRVPDGSRDERKQRPRHALCHVEDQVGWLARQGGAHGFDLQTSDADEWFDTDYPSAKYDVTVRDEGTLRTGKKTKGGVSMHHSVLFEGCLQVTDSTEFATALRTGIGPGKAFGFGLLSVAPVHVGDWP